jgi:hypothetical protein
MFASDKQVHRRITTLALGLVALGAACTDDVTSPTLVEDLRVLAVRAEPPELLFERDELVAGPARAVHFEALVVDPRGLPMVYDWQFCPIESSETCGDYERKRAAAPAGYAEALDAARGQRLGGSAAPAPGGAQVMGGFDVAITPPLFGYHLLSSGLGLGNGGWASAVLTLAAGPEANRETLRAQKRVVLGARDLAAFNSELATVGVSVCPDPAQALPAGCLPLRPRTPNRNPEILGMEIARGAAATTPFAPVTGAIDLVPNEKIRLRPVVAPDAEEPYQTIESTLEGSRLYVADRREELVVSWFATSGEFEEPQTAVQISKRIDNIYTAPAPGPGAPAPTAIFVVIRDQRGGVAWLRLDANVQ